MKKKINRRTFLKVMGAAALAASAGGLSGCGSTGENGEKTTIIRVAFNQPETHAEYIALADFGEKFAAATHGRYQMEIYPNAVLGDQGPVTEIIRTGALRPARVCSATSVKAPMPPPRKASGGFPVLPLPSGGLTASTSTWYVRWHGRPSWSSSSRLTRMLSKPM